MVKKQSEKEIQRSICDWLFTEGYFFWRQNNIPVFDKGRFRAMPKYSSKGSPDIMIIHKGKFIGIEVKSTNYWKFTDDQQRFKDNIISNGGFYFIATSLGEVQAKILEIAYS